MKPDWREPMLMDLKQRIRDVRQGPDGFLYLLTAEEDGAVLKIEPRYSTFVPQVWHRWAIAGDHACRYAMTRVEMWSRSLKGGV